MRIDQGFADVNGTRLYYEIAGAGHPLVLIHGFSLDTRMWDDQVEVFARHYQVVRYDLRGFGKSALPTPNTYNHADDLRVLIDHLGVDAAYIIGQSMGGRIAINFALAYPQTTDALIVVDAAIEGFPRTGESPTLATMARAKRQGIESAKTLWLQHSLFAPAYENPSVASQLAQMVSAYSGWHWLNEDSLDTPGRPAVQRLHTIAAPTLVMVGERDLLDYHLMADAMAVQIPDAKKIVIPQVGHMANMEAPERFNEIVFEFLASRYQ